MMMHLCNIKHDGMTLRVEAAKYRNGRPAIVVKQENGDPWATFSCNIPEARLEEKEFLAKTWSENESLRAPMLASGKFFDTGVRVRTGFVEAEVWAIR